MRIQVSKKLPPVEELLKVFKNEFSNHYSYKLFGLGNKSILVGKSTLLGAQISVFDNEVSINSSPPSFFAGIVHAMGSTELMVLLFPMFFQKGGVFSSTYVNLEKEIGAFLLNKYR